MFEPHLGDKLAHAIISIFEPLSLGMGQPHDKGLALVGLHPPLHNLEEEFLLAFSPEAAVSPVADESAHGSSLLALSESPEHIQSIHLESMASLSSEIGLSPSVEKLGLDFLIGIEPHKVLVLIVLMNEVHGMSIPLSETVSLPLSGVFLHNFDELSNSFLQVFHVFGAVFNLLDRIFSSFVQSLAQDLKEKLSSEEPHMGLVSPDY